MASCFRTFRKPKCAEEERNLIENAILKSTLAVTKWSVKIVLEWQNVTKKQKSSNRVETLNMHPPFVVSVEC